HNDIIILSFFFFFSSRRRHTRWPRDWSSDVCSSDLTMNNLTIRTATLQNLDAVMDLLRKADLPVEDLPRVFGENYCVAIMNDSRSEERRVGKECRSRWWGEYYKEKR